ncbi:flagellar biosynthesis anti-sigma factor FlgM [Paenibacillus aurantius]|uniref:Negative regulator of flagellin synthesis n=1 Tax=Paenibacillus aurantius TaxID=2918900 RepID=A0AA96LHL9_9BACL|nr:flagellar biosynthesis anti-sigma factor FlgM [Paenibacillus aurantius]WNQ11597.1 flagellar biosynthesis anti-sigma factor FlgM [Paenibacillus aurantius]
MKINETPRVGNVNPYKRQQQEAREALTTGKKGKAKDEVQISAEAKELQEAHGTQQSAELRSKRIAELKQAVSTGTYHVDAGKIAEKLLPYIK